MAGVSRAFVRAATAAPQPPPTPWPARGSLPIVTSLVTVQLLSADGVCWEAVYSAPFIKNTSGAQPVFKDKAD